MLTILITCLYLLSYYGYIQYKNFQQKKYNQKAVSTIAQIVKSKDISDYFKNIRSMHVVVLNITESIHNHKESFISLIKIIENDIAENDNTESNNKNQSYVGVFSITAYTWTGNAMANGEYPYVGCAASCDFPIDTTIYIENIGTYVIKDICPTSGVIDLYMNTYDECINFGRRTANVYVIQNGEIKNI